MDYTQENISAIGDNIAEKVKDIITSDMTADKWLDLQGTIKYSKVSKNTLKKWISEGYIYGKRAAGGKTIISRESIDNFYNSENFEI
ncbi:MAG: helix-turn-helix domain-containing protein [Desulfobacterales bacterium]|nr:helix-turn-helix domain-containing protein [Desulfobacterales bacterium]